MVDQVCEVKDAQFIRSNRSYVFEFNNNLPLHYNLGLQNHENFSYENQGNFQQAPQNSSAQYAPLGFQGHGVSNSNFQGQKRSSSFEDTVIALLTASKKKSEAQDHQISNLESEMTNFKTNQANMNVLMKNLENQIGQLAHSMKESSSRSFPSDT